jgi:hypothetical protein
MNKVSIEAYLFEVLIINPKGNNTKMSKENRHRVGELRSGEVNNLRGEGVKST